MISDFIVCLGGVCGVMLCVWWWGLLFLACCFALCLSLLLGFVIVASCSCFVLRCGC